jgi:hypothetical protein
VNGQTSVVVNWQTGVVVNGQTLLCYGSVANRSGVQYCKIQINFC